VALLLTLPDLPPAWSNALEKRDAGGSHGSFEFQRALAMVNRTYVLCATVVRAGPALFSALSAVGHPAAEPAPSEHHRCAGSPVLQTGPAAAQIARPPPWRSDDATPAPCQSLATLR
jgi:hypothetical protein